MNKSLEFTIYSLAFLILTAVIISMLNLNKAVSYKIYAALFGASLYLAVRMLYVLLKGKKE